MAAEEMFRAADDLPVADRQLLTAIRKTLWGYEPLRATRERRAWNAFRSDCSSLGH